jgi:predicted DNA-binding transcriptional regulator YafY
MARNEQLIRQHKILQILERRRYGIRLEDLRDALVDELGLSSLHERSVRRDIEALQAAGFDIDTEESSQGKVWKLRHNDKGIHRLNVSATELIALSMGRDLMLPLAGTQFWHGIEGFWNKVREQLPAGVWELFERYRRTLLVSGVVPKSYEKHHGILKSLHRAIDEHRVVEIEYRSAGKPSSTRYICPYGIVVHQGSIYLLATLEPQSEDASASELRHWKLDRFVKATPLDRWFKPDSQIDLSQHVQRTIGIFSGEAAQRYRIWLTPKATLWLQEDPWHSDQQLEALEGGGAILSVPAHHPMEIIPRVLELGEEAEVLSPLECREMIRDVLADRLSRYDRAPEDPLPKK